jgi:A/G-specific adenine glycosylase
MTPVMANPARCSKALLGWYDIHRRVLPWRAAAGRRADPYHVWLSEIMLQQTTVQAVADYYRKFLTKWPTVADLAAAPQDEVLAAWAGLGYYARARNLHKAAGVVAHELGGRFPETAAELRKLPGVAPYTSGAIAAIAFDGQEAAMDANAERVVARLFAVEEPLPGCKPKLLELGRALVPEKRAGDFAQALMDLGAGICTVKRPACPRCPLAKGCEARAKGIAETLPVKGPKAVRPLKRGAAFVVRNAEGAVLLLKRPEKGLLASMLEPPLGPWTAKFPSRDAALKQAPFPAAWKKLPGIVRHGFTHFELEIEVWVVEGNAQPKPNQNCHPRPERAARRGRGPRSSNLDDAGELAPSPSVEPTQTRPPGSPSLGPRRTSAASPASPGMTEVFWVMPERLGEVALPTVMRKIIAHAPPDDGPLFSPKTKTPRR